MRRALALALLAACCCVARGASQADITSCGPDCSVYLAAPFRACLNRVQPNASRVVYPDLDQWPTFEAARRWAAVHAPSQLRARVAAGPAPAAPRPGAHACTHGLHLPVTLTPAAACDTSQPPTHRTFNARVVRSPAAIFYAHDAADVSAAVTCGEETSEEERPRISLSNVCQSLLCRATLHVAVLPRLTHPPTDSSLLPSAYQFGVRVSPAAGRQGFQGAAMQDGYLIVDVTNLTEVGLTMMLARQKNEKARHPGHAAGKAGQGRPGRVGWVGRSRAALLSPWRRLDNALAGCTAMCKPDAL